ncbi:phytanoyl-CoA dioxygenase family protein [Kiritimatiellaeota bacterium B1221]|nr:phytanoyl-CoA dioxygenase family protein [Kiritimatiellaeota bacterium B1221]
MTTPTQNPQASSPAIGTANPHNPMTAENVDQYWKDGYTVIKNVFAPHEVEQMKTACDRWKFTGELLGKTWRKKNTIIWVESSDPENVVVRGMQWPSYHDPVMDHYRTDPRLLMILEPLIGINIKQVINQVHWKKPGSKVSWPLHRDVRSRQPVDDFKDLFPSWVQCGIALDPHRAENGAMKVVPGSHMDYEHNPRNRDLYNVPEYANDDRIKDMVMNPGDVALWSAYTVHGGGFNTTEFMDRRLYINGFVKAENCERGEWAWREGRTCHLHGKQALIQFNEVDTIAEAFYAQDRNRVEKISD